MTRLECELNDEVERLRDAVSVLRSQLQLTRIFVEGKALVPDPNVLMVIDHVLADTKKHARW